MSTPTTTSASFAGLNWSFLSATDIGLRENRQYSYKQIVNAAKRFQNVNARTGVIQVAEGVSSDSPSCCCDCLEQRLIEIGFDIGGADIISDPSLSPYNPDTNPCGYTELSIVCNSDFTYIPTQYPLPECNGRISTSLVGTYQHSRTVTNPDGTISRSFCNIIIVLKLPCGCPAEGRSPGNLPTIATVEEIPIPDEYSTPIQFSNRNYIRVGTPHTDTYRGVIFVSPRDQIQSALVAAGKGSSAGYAIQKANLTLTAMSGDANIPVIAFMLPLSFNVDESISWEKPSSGGNEYFDNYGGDIEPLSEGIQCYGQWSGTNTVSFDITPYINIWNGSNTSKLGLMITHEESVPGFETFFYSSEATTPFIGGAPLTNCKFLGAGAANSTSTEGVRVRFTTSGNSVVLQSMDTGSTGSANWAAFNAAISVGATFSMSMPDITVTPSFSEKVNNDETATEGYKAFIFTVLDKLSYNGIPSIVVDEYTSVFTSDFYTTAEFSCVSSLPTGTGILEFTDADTKLLTDLKQLKVNDPLYINYTATNTPNNARGYTVKFYSDETLKKDRVRVYLNEAAVTENRNGMYTEIKPQGVQPRMTISVQPLAFTDREGRDVEVIKGRVNEPVMFSEKVENIPTAMKGRSEANYPPIQA